MRLKKSRNAADEDLAVLINEGYVLHRWFEDDYRDKKAKGTYDPEKDNPRYDGALTIWGNRVCAKLQEIFPTHLEANFFCHDPPRANRIYSGVNQAWAQIRDYLSRQIDRVRDIRADHLKQYTDLPLQDRLHVEDIDSFRKARDVNPAQVAHLLKDGKYLNLPEDAIQNAIEQLVDEPFHKKDWGGEGNDLYTANIVVNGARTATAFIFKGNGLKRDTMRIRDCGHNGDQLVRLFESPAELFVVQFVGNVEENLIKDVASKVNEKRLQGKQACFCIMNGQDTARLLFAYGKLPTQTGK